jgi:hypothetical protein
MRISLKNSPEGLPWHEYKLLEFLLAAPIGYPAGIFLELMWRCSRKNSRLIGVEHLPENAIIYGFHVDVCLNYMTMRLLKDAGRRVLFCGGHNFVSYWAAGPGSMGAYQTWRYDRRLPTKPLQQIVNMLGGEPHALFGIFSDGAAGERCRIRESLVKLSIATRRPVVPYRSLYSPSARLGGDDYPVGLFVSGTSVFGQPIEFERLEQLDLEAARMLLENELYAVSHERLLDRVAKAK